MAFKAGDVVFTVPRSMFRADVNGVVQVGEHQVPAKVIYAAWAVGCLLYTSPSPRDRQKSRMPSSA